MTRLTVPIGMTAALLACGGPPAPRAPAPVAVAAPDPDAPVAATPMFVFHSRFSPNLHDRLRRWALDENREGADCVGDDAGWARAVEAFGGLGDLEGHAYLRVRYAVMDPSDPGMDEPLGPLPEWYRPALQDAEPAYRRCFWDEDDRVNRSWIAALVTLLERGEEPMAERIAAAHGLAWTDLPLEVDVVPDVNFGGGNTVVHPHHTLISSTQPGYAGYGALEVLFHEASHTIVSPRSEGSIAALRAAAEIQNAELPRDLWHATLFYVAGESARMTVQELWGEDYVQYAVTQDVYTRAWPTWLAPLEASFGPRVRGEVTLEEASRVLLAAVLAP